MCGVLGYIHETSRPDLGKIAGRLLESLQYRGYDSTGAAIQHGDSVELRKGVGAPSALIHSLGIVDLAGQVFCGQVRWATFGAVDDANAQPHEVRCKTHLYGAHNGNVNNTDGLKTWLRAEGHTVQSDNDGEMVVHTVEHFFAAALETTDDRKSAMRQAVVQASSKLRGSFAAVVVDPVSKTVCAIKRGSSLYFGVGHDAAGAFSLASSDLSSVLLHTHQLVSLHSGEFVLYDATHFEVRQVVDGHPEGREVSREPTRSRLRATDTALGPGYSTFMHQEIDAQPETCANVLRMLAGGSDVAHACVMSDETAQQSLRDLLDRIAAAPEAEPLVDDVTTATTALPLLAEVGAKAQGAPFYSSEAALFAELSELMPDHAATVRGLDAALERVEAVDLTSALDKVGALFSETHAQRGRIFMVCCGTSYHAAKAGALFFAELAGVDVLPLLPGEFRGQYANLIRQGDVFVAISQSGETKDLIDVLDDARRHAAGEGIELPCVALVNNLNSTLAQERADIVVPLRCGPEIAVPATKSFINQLTLLYGLAHRLGRRLGRDVPALPDLPGLIRDTLEATRSSADEAAERLYLTPSMHLLATRLSAVAKEGALKIREVVLNHTEGFEGSEFKHGPNTILGFNTIFGAAQVQTLLDRLADEVHAGASPESVRNGMRDHIGALYAEYPLVFITGPAERDVDLTISQIHTHKIRGAHVVVVAEKNERLHAAASGMPAGRNHYDPDFIWLPKTDQTALAVFSSTVALQLLALAMSEKKRAFLDRLGVPDHGVHPDVPKNVSKSITVD